MKFKKILIIIACLLSVSSFNFVFSQNNDTLSISAEIYLESYIKNTMSFTVKNLTADTVYASFFLQALTDIDDIIITNSYDIYTKGGKKEAVTRILPQESIYIKTKVQEIKYIEKNDIPYGIKHKEIKYRLLLKMATIKEIRKRTKIYSNWVYRE